MNDLAPGGRGVGSVPAGYVTLFHVQFKHEFYNVAGGACPDLAVSPTPACAKLMASLGVELQRRATGFALHAPAVRAPAIAGFIASQASNPTPTAEVWSRFTFLVAATKPDFVGLTRLPMTFKPTLQNLYATNGTVTSGTHGLSMGSRPTLGREALCELTNGPMRLAATAGAVVTLSDVSGATIRSVTARGGFADVSFAGLPYGRYTLAAAPGAGSKAATPPRAVIYGPGSPIHIGMIDLLLAAPTADAPRPEAFPLPRPFGGAPSAITPVALTLSFAARSTKWQYFVVSQKPGGTLGADIAISGPGISFIRSEDTLPTGAPAAVFTASKPLPLRQLSPYAFQLSGHRQAPGGVCDPIKVDRLPPAPPAPVWPATGSATALTARSEIYVYV